MRRPRAPEHAERRPQRPPSGARLGAVAQQAVLVAAALVVGACGPGPEPAPAPARVLLVVLDATHAAHLGSYGGPGRLARHLDALAGRGRRFAHAVSNNTWTLPSTASLMTGQLQERHGVVTNKHELDDDTWVLAEHFAAHGWDTVAFSEMIYASAVHGLDQGFADARYYSITAGPHPFTMVREAELWMREHADDHWFAYLHLRRPHSPYDPSAPARLRVEGGCELADGRRDDVLAHADSRIGPDDVLTEAEVAHIEHLYRANLSAADDQLADILAAAAADPELLVIVTSDHGEALGQHGSWGHGYELYAENVDVPLMLAGPGVTPGVDNGPASTVDIVPTLLELCRLDDVPPGVILDGRSLAARLAGREPRDPERPVPLSARYVPGRLPAQGVVAGRFKLIVDVDGVARLFDRTADPGETTDVSAAHPDVVSRLGTLALERRELGRDSASRGVVDIPVREEELRALGYLR